MEQLMEHTLQKQLADLSAQVAKLTPLVEQLTLTSVSAAIINNAPVMNQQNITIMPWDGERRIQVDVDQIALAFAENARLREYVRLGDHELVDPDIAPPYVTELFVDLVRRGHADQSTRNIYLNPRREDQVLVHMKSGRWEVVSLQEASRLLFDGVLAAILAVKHLTAAARKTLPAEAQNALALAGMLYEDEPDTYVKRAKPSMSAHLANMAPPL